LKDILNFRTKTGLFFGWGGEAEHLENLMILQIKKRILRLKSVIDHYAAQGGNLEEDIIKTMNNYI
jgi:hypothetical protein